MLGGVSFVAGAATIELGSALKGILKRPVSPYSERIRRSIVKVAVNSAPAGFGTGFCISSGTGRGTSIIATASHVVGGARIRNLDGQPDATSVQAHNGSSDIIRAPWCQEDWMDICAFSSQLQLQPFELAEESPAIGQTIFAIGFTEDGSYEVNIGTVSGLSVEGGCRITSNARIVPGMSGGPILNRFGQVVGMSVTGSHTGRLSGLVPLYELRNLRERMWFIERAIEADSKKK